MKNYDSIYFKDRQSFNSWLQKNHYSCPGIWMIYYKKHYILWISQTKKEETRTNRIHESIQLLIKGKKLGLK